MTLPQRARRVLRSLRQAIPAGVILGRVSAGNGPAEFIPITEATNALLDDISAVQGSVLYRGSTVWEALAPGTANEYLQTQGAAANPAWAQATLALPNSFFDKIVFQSNFEGADLQTTFVGMDDSFYNHEIVVENGSPALTTTNAKFGTTALNYDLTDAAVRVKACGDEFQIGAQAFFIEMFVSIDSQNQAHHMGVGSAANSDAMWRIRTNAGGNQFQFEISTDGTTYSEPLSDIAVTTGNMVHVLIVSDGVTLSSYVNGTRDDTAAFSSTLFASSADFIIGGIEGTYDGRAEIDGFRMGIGTTGPYDPDDATITVPTEYYETTDNTSDLVRQGEENRFYCMNEMLEDVDAAFTDTATIGWTYSTTTKLMTANINSASVTNAMLADVATATMKGRTTAGTGSPEDLTPAQARAVMGLGTLAVEDYTDAGTWTPAFAFATPGDSTITHTVQDGVYTRIGNLVFFNLFLNFSTNAYTTAAGGIRISGLPFTARLDTSLSFYQGNSLFVSNVTVDAAAIDVVAFVEDNSTHIRAFQTRNAAGVLEMGILNFPASTSSLQIRMSGFYPV